MRWVDATRHLPIDDAIFHVLVAVSDDVERSDETPESLAETRRLGLRGFSRLGRLGFGLRDFGLSVLSLDLVREQWRRNNHSN